MKKSRIVEISRVDVGITQHNLQSHHQALQTESHQYPRNIFNPIYNDACLLPAYLDDDDGDADDDGEHHLRKGKVAHRSSQDGRIGLSRQRMKGVGGVPWMVTMLGGVSLDGHSPCHFYSSFCLSCCAKYFAQHDKQYFYAPKNHRYFYLFLIYA